MADGCVELRTVLLADNRIGDQAAACLVEALGCPGTGRLERLDLSQNQLGCKSSEALARMLQSSRMLRCAGCHHQGSCHKERATMRAALAAG